MSECRRCNENKEDVEQRYSFGIPVGELCCECACEAYKDQCGLVKNADGTYSEDGAQGAVEDLDEFAYGGYDAIYGEEG